MDVLYEALKRVHKKLDAEFLIFGDAQSKEERLIKKKMISLAKKDTRIKLLGSFERNKISHILSQIDVLIVPSVFVETGPLTVLEAFLAKVPVIGSNLPGISEYIKDEVNGLLFEMGNSLELSLCIQRICKEKELLERLKRGIDRVKSIYEHTQEIISVYKKLLRK
jgi:glycosyltransferase involved in cell wall biosynthesis